MRWARDKRGEGYRGLTGTFLSAFAAYRSAQSAKDTPGNEPCSDLECGGERGNGPSIRLNIATEGGADRNLDLVHSRWENPEAAADRVAWLDISQASHGRRLVAIPQLRQEVAAAGCTGEDG
jgi:hypothetical protein